MSYRYLNLVMIENSFKFASCKNNKFIANGLKEPDYN